MSVCMHTHDIYIHRYTHRDIYTLHTERHMHLYTHRDTILPNLFFIAGVYKSHFTSKRVGEKSHQATELQDRNLNQDVQSQTSVRAYIHSS